MAWTLQPRSYMQVIRPNFYDVSYRRTGAYKGMGQVDTSTLFNLPMVGQFAPGNILPS